MSKIEKIQTPGSEIAKYLSENYPHGVLTKISDDKFEGNHPNGFNVGPTSQGIVSQKPLVGQSCVVGRVYTSTVTEIVEICDKHTIFKTLNSTYKIEFPVEHTFKILTEEEINENRSSKYEYIDI